MWDNAKRTENEGGAYEKCIKSEANVKPIKMSSL